MLINEFFGALLLFLLVGLFFTILALPIVLAIAIVVVVMKLVLFLLFLPFRVLGWAVATAVGR